MCDRFVSRSVLSTVDLDEKKEDPTFCVPEELDGNHFVE